MCDQQAQLCAPEHGPSRTARRRPNRMLFRVDAPSWILFRGDDALPRVTANGETKTARRTMAFAHHGDVCRPTSQGKRTGR